MNEEEKEFFETRIPILRRHYELVSCFNGQVNEEETKKLFTYISQLRKENRKLQQERNNYKELYEKENKNWNELKEWIEEQKEFIENTPTFTSGVKHNHIGMIGSYRNVLDKMQEIERL